MYVCKHYHEVEHPAKYLITSGRTCCDWGQHWTACVIHAAELRARLVAEVDSTCPKCGDRNKVLIRRIQSL